jgi:branched-chain amino acid transport system substrate-binding protein
MAGSRLRAGISLAAVATAAIALAACAPRGPLRIGYIGSLSGSGADMGEEGRNGAMLAVEERNAAGGIGGRRIELVVSDDASVAEAARAAAASLIASKIELAIGSNNSAMADVVVPVFDRAGVVLISPNVSAMRFVGRDDYYFRMNSSTRVNSAQYARFLAERRGRPPASLLWDSSNATFSKSWLDEFRASYAAAGGRVLSELAFDPRAAGGYGGLVDETMARGPGAILLVANAIDSARFAQLFRKSGSKALFAAAEWAGTPQLIELGGRAVEGLLMLQEYDPFDAGPRFALFSASFRERFKSEPSFTSVLSWDACQAAFAALEGRRPGEGVKGALLRLGPFQGLQQKVSFDAFGDSRREAVFSEIRNGIYQKAE